MNRETVDKKDLEFNTQIYEILNELGEEFIKKIPNQLYEYFEYNRNENSIFEVDITRPLEEQEIMQDVLLFLAYLKMQYWATEEEKQQLFEKYKELDKIQELEKKEKYNWDNLFAKNPVSKSEIEVENTEVMNNLPAKIEKESWLKKIINKIFAFINKC